MLNRSVDAVRREVPKMTREEIETVVKEIYSDFEALDANKLDENFSHTEALTAFGTDEGEIF